MSSIRRLSDEDVRAVFESLHGDHQPPPHLNFKIVPVGPTALRLSPPSYEFEDGLYVLLKPDKKRKNARDWVPDLSMVPSHLRNLTMTDFPPKICPWSLSGPQFPQPTAIQQRYCYPKGEHEYSSRKGGALWTMYERNGKEDLQFRLLHVYFSAKRAINKGVDVATEGVVASKRTPTSTPRRRRKGTPNRSSQSPWNEKTYPPHSTPRSIHTTVTESPLNMPAPVTTFRPFAMATSWHPDQDIFVSPFTNVTDFLGQPFHPLPSFELESLDEKAFMAPEQSDFQMMERCFQDDAQSSSRHGTKRTKTTTQALMASDSAIMDLESSWTLNFGYDSEEDAYRQMDRRLSIMGERVRSMVALETDKDHARSAVVNWARSIESTTFDGHSGSQQTDQGHDRDVIDSTFSPLEDAAICHLCARLGPRWEVIAKRFPRHSTLEVKSRFETLRKEFESGLAKINPSTELAESAEALKHSVLLKGPNANMNILRYLADYILKEDGKGAVEPPTSFGPFRVAKAAEACKRCGLIVPSLQTGRIICEKTGWCKKCSKLSAIVYGDYLREIYPLKPAKQRTASV
ncbi:unnamed protein product [Cylindrotheca closterium]|uniref:HTH myb-type domain-containing protein n=1 Tax=Cylindrotheca closterium TaxID=2856 RepID=A0AAD2GBW6_9STRA|nr:unnamed protein product [Cylindrotheca closterium]